MRFDSQNSARYESIVMTERYNDFNNTNTRTATASPNAASESESARAKERVEKRVHIIDGWNCFHLKFTVC